METNIKIQCRKEDVSLVEKAIAEAATAYEESMGDKVTATIDEENIPSSNAGGVILSGLNGKIKVNNTLEARLSILEEGVSAGKNHGIESTAIFLPCISTDASSNPSSLVWPLSFPQVLQLVDHFYNFLFYHCCRERRCLKTPPIPINSAVTKTL